MVLSLIPLQLRRRTRLSRRARWACAPAFIAGLAASVHAGAPARPADSQLPSPADGAVSLAVNGAATFDAAWQAIRDTFVDDGRSEREWVALRDEFRPRASAAKTDAALRDVLREMLARLGRSHFDVLPPAAAVATAHDRRTEGAADVGLEVTPLAGEPVVTRVVPSGPANRVGVRPGWTVEDIAGEDPRNAARFSGAAPDAERSGFRLWARTVTLLRGATGTTVPVTFRDPSGRTVPVTLTRDTQPGEPVTLGLLPTFVAHLDHRLITSPGGGAVGYIHFNVWMTALSPAIDRAVDEYRTAPGLVIDLRQNPGGVLTMLMGVSGHFFDAPRSLGTVRTRTSELRLVANPRLVNAEGVRVGAYAGRVAILVDQTWYSASEVFAGGMQGTGRARIFGSTTPGGALPALMRQLPNGDVLEYAIGDFVTSAGQRIEGRGVVPDEPVQPSATSIVAGQDPVLDAAVRWAGGSS